MKAFQNMRITFRPITYPTTSFREQTYQGPPNPSECSLQPMSHEYKMPSSHLTIIHSFCHDAPCQHTLHVAPPIQNRIHFHRLYPFASSDPDLLSTGSLPRKIPAISRTERRFFSVLDLSTRERKLLWGSKTLRTPT